MAAKNPVNIECGIYPMERMLNEQWASNATRITPALIGPQ